MDNYTNFELWMFGPGTVMGSKLRVLDFLMIGIFGVLMAVLLILIIIVWNENNSLQNEVNDLKQQLDEHMNPMKRALDNAIDVFEFKEAKGIPGGYAELDHQGRIPKERLPPGVVFNEDKRSPPSSNKRFKRNAVK